MWYSAFKLIWDEYCWQYCLLNYNAFNVILFYALKHLERICLSSLNCDFLLKKRVKYSNFSKANNTSIYHQNYPHIKGYLGCLLFLVKSHKPDVVKWTETNLKKFVKEPN